MNPNLEKPLKVSEFIGLINASLETIDAFIEGEISQFNISHSKWAFFSLKDDKALVECFMPVYEMKTAVEVGMKVLIWGSPGVHTKSGRFRIRVYQIEPFGEGALKRAFELTKAKLEQEGIFAPERKRSLPEFPQKVALITSKESAAFSDFIKVLRHRIGGLTIFLAHVHVQGVEAIEEIVGAFQYFNAHYQELNLDAVVLIRGGGSLEDLQAFNSEEVARAVFGSKTPVIVGVGHERDETLADLAADLRASTPSNAAEILVKSRSEIASEIETYLTKIQNILSQEINRKIFLIERFFIQADYFLTNKKSIFENAFNLLWAKFLSFEKLFLKSKEKFNEYFERYDKSFLKFINNLNNKLNEETRLLESFNPFKIINRGYAIVKDKKSNKIVKSAKDTKINQILDLTMKDGAIESSVINIKTS